MPWKDNDHDRDHASSGTGALMMTRRRTLFFGLLVAASLTLGAAPPISPAVAQQGGDRDAPGITAQEAQLGREQHKQALVQFGGAYDTPDPTASLEDTR